MGRLPCLLAWVLTSLCAAAAEYRFDMGGTDTPVAPGFTQVLPDTRFGPDSAFGWTRPARDVIWRDGPGSPLYGNADSEPLYAAYVDAILSIEENEFVFRVEPGRYTVTAVIGDLATGEHRPGNSLWANGIQIATKVATNANLLAIAFPVLAPDGLVTLRFRADSLQQYVTVEAVLAVPLAGLEDLPVRMTEIPAAVTAEDYRRGWARFQKLYAADWATARQQLAQQGVDVEAWSGLRAGFTAPAGGREYWPSGGTRWEIVDAQAGGIDAAEVCRCWREMGVDGIVCAEPVFVRELRKYGMKHAVAGHAEAFPRADMTGITLNLLQRPDGTFGTRDRVWSNCDPAAVEAYRSLWKEAFSGTAPTAEFFMIDEPRGQWYSGEFGDVSDPAQRAFRAWAAEQGWDDLAAKGIPPRGRTLDFYRFYRFRLESVPRFVKAAVEGTPVQDLPIMPGNGSIGPESMNHSSYWPPAVARHGMISAAWSYDSPAGAKAHAETIRMAREWGGQSYCWPPSWKDPVRELPTVTANISALCDRVCQWHFGGNLNGPQRPAWMAATFLAARLTHATNGLEHTPPLTVWCPDAIVYNDLVEMNTAEADAWRRLQQTLFAANLDYAVTNRLTLPAGSVVLYACARPVLDRADIENLTAFVKAGGRLLVTFAGAPEQPDGSPIEEWQGGLQAATIRVELAPAALRAKANDLCALRNWVPDSPAVKTYLYRRSDGPRPGLVHLLNHTDTDRPTTVVLPAAMRDRLTGKTLPAGHRLDLPPGHYALLEELPRD
jgi:hypothetical protein